MKQETKKRRAREGLFNTYVTKNDTLSNRHNAKHVRESLELVLFVTTHHIVLLDIFQALALPNDDKVWYYGLGKFHHLVVEGFREQKHLAIFRHSPKRRGSKWRGEVRRRVTMVALFLDDNKTNGDGKENGKNSMFLTTNNNFTCASLYFVHFFAVVAPLRRETS